MEKSYSYIGNEHSVDLVRAAFAAVLEDMDYHLEVSGVGPGGPHVYEFRRDNTVLALKVDETMGEKWESELSLETEHPDEEFRKIVVTAISGLLADISKRLLESVLDPTCRSAVVVEFKRLLATLE